MRGGWEALFLVAFFFSWMRIMYLWSELTCRTHLHLKENRKMHTPLYDCPRCIGRQDQSNISSIKHPDGKDIDIIVTYSDPSGAIQVRSVKSKGLSSSWVWKSPGDENHHQTKKSLGIYPYRSELHIAKLALGCLEGEPKNRPPMQEIVETLERIDSANERPKERRIHHAVHQPAATGQQQSLQYHSPLHPRQEVNQAYPLPERV